MADYRDDFIIAIRYALLKKGAKQKFSLFFLIIISILIILFDRLSLSFMKPTRSILNDFIYYVAVVSSKPGEIIKYSYQFTSNHLIVYRENKTLKEEIKFLNQNKFNNVYLTTENKILKTALDLSYDTDVIKDFSVPARVILEQESPFLKSLMINKGSKNDIMKGMSVFNKNFLLGTVIEVNYLTSRVLLLTDLNSKLPVIIENTDVNAILAGEGKKSDLRLDYLPENYQLEENKIIFTSGKGGFIRAGIPVAKTYLNKDNEILIKLLADPNQALIIHVSSGQFQR